MYKLQLSGRSNGHNNLVTRVMSICDKYTFSLIKYVFDNNYSKVCKTNIKAFTVADGVVDSVAHLLNNFSCQNREMLRLLLWPF